MKDLDRIWAAQDGKHEIIVKNIHDMLVKLAWDFSAEQLDHLFGCFQVRGSEVGEARLGRWAMFKYISAAAHSMYSLHHILGLTL